MKKIAAGLALALLCGCAMTPAQKNAVALVGTALVVGAVAAHGGRNAPDISDMTPAHPKGCPSGPPKSHEIYIC
jgi:hypothetical protein